MDQDSKLNMLYYVSQTQKSGQMPKMIKTKVDLTISEKSAAEQLFEADRHDGDFEFFDPDEED